MPCKCAEPKKEKVFETIELDYENNQEYRIIEFICKECNRSLFPLDEKTDLGYLITSRAFWRLL
jgi:hypothetical protein